MFEDEFADELGKVDESLLRDEPEEEKPVEEEQTGEEEAPEEEAPKEESKEDEPKEEEPKPEEEEERSKYIPRGRFDEVNSKYRSALEELEALRAEKEQAKPKEEAPEPVDVIALEREYLQASLDGDDDKAIELRKTINAELIRQAEERAYKRSEERMTKREQELATQREQETLDKTAARLVKENPLLDSETGDPKLIAEVIEWRDYLHTTKGIPIAEALEQAVKKVAPVKPKQEEVPPDTRRQEEIKNNAEAANRQPPPVEGVGNRAMDVKPLLPEDQDEYEKTPVAERKKLLM